MVIKPSDTAFVTGSSMTAIASKDRLAVAANVNATECRYVDQADATAHLQHLAAHAILEVRGRAVIRGPVPGAGLQHLRTGLHVAMVHARI